MAAVLGHGRTDRIEIFGRAQTFELTLRCSDGSLKLGTLLFQRSQELRERKAVVLISKEPLLDGFKISRDAQCFHIGLCISNHVV